ncbi:MAG TPA: M48 family metalloprotease [Burkholderiales bacterium]|nr:M48 family metalloprotease [Burkholderiales bacterium]
MKLLVSLAATLMLAQPPLASAQALPNLGDSAQTVLSSQQERQLGESIMRQIRGSKQYFDDPEVTDYVNALGYRLVAQSPNTEQAFEFFVVDDPTINAFALPGGFIGVHTGLIVTAQSESEFAGVIAHEIAHVTQHHIARLFQQQKQAGIASLAAIAIALLAARSSPDLASAAMAGAQYATIQTGLNFTRDNEREADRVGVQILQRAGFDSTAMAAFLDRMQRAYRAYETNAPSYVRTHPLTYERIADVQNRVADLPYKQVPDSMDFLLVRARLQVLGGSPRDAIERFDDILKEKKTVHEVAAQYGLVFALLEAKDLARAKREAAVLQREAPDNALVLSLVAKVNWLAGERDTAMRMYADAIDRFPRRRALAFDYSRALLEAKRPKEALAALDRAQQLLQPDYRLLQLKAQTYSALGQRLQQHRAQAEAYVLLGSVPAAIEQLQIGLRSGDGDYYQLSSAEARLRELRVIDAQTRKRSQQ